MITLTEDRLKIEIERPKQASGTLFSYQNSLINCLSGQELSEDDRYYLADLLKELSLSTQQIKKVELEQVA